MAYTYDDFVAAANKAGLMNQFSETDLVTAQKNPEYGLSMLSLKQDELNAKTAEQKLLASEAANQLRKSYGTESALDGQIRNLQSQIGSFGSFQYDNETEYQKALKAVTDPVEFSYDQDSDPQYGAMRQAMLRERDRSVADTLARASAASGGMPSSYAVTAAQQAGDYYTGKLGDAGITLYQNALDKYMKDRNLDLSRLEALRSDRDDDYQIWLNRLGLLQNQLETLQGQKNAQQAQAATQYQQLLQEKEGQKPEVTPWSMPESMITALKGNFPSGNVTNKSYWLSLVALYGEAALKEAGFYYNSGSDAGDGLRGNGKPFNTEIMLK